MQYYTIIFASSNNNKRIKPYETLRQIADNEECLVPLPPLVEHHFLGSIEIRLEESKEGSRTQGTRRKGIGSGKGKPEHIQQAELPHVQERAVRA